MKIAVLALLIYLGACLVLSSQDPPVSFSPEAIRATNPSLPVGFLLGTATAAYQIEGDNPNCDWASFERQKGRIERGERNGRASDGWNRVGGDIALMHDLGANAYRFSLEWSRLEPRRGVWDEKAWAHYQDELSRLRAAGITPMVTLLHFTMPQWLEGGATAPEFPERFGRFAAEAARRLAPSLPETSLWCTLNEPNVQMLAGYYDGIWPPGQHEPAQALKALAGLARAHALASRALRDAIPGVRVGIAINLVLIEPYSRWSLLDWKASQIASDAYNWALCDSFKTGRLVLKLPGWPVLDEAIPGLAGSVDYFGMNYYFRCLIRFSPGSPGMFERITGPGPRTDLDWEIYPEGLLRLLRAAWKRYELPIYITENGIAEASGQHRPDFIQAHLYAVTRALAEGIPVKGFFYWSLLDNFEWAEGFRPRFGLYRVDYKTFERTEAPGCETFRAWAKALKPRQGPTPAC